MKYTKQVLEEAVKQSKCYSDVARYFGKPTQGGSIGHIKQKILKFGIDVSHFITYINTKKKINKNKRHWTEILVSYKRDYRESSIILTRALLESGVEYKCSECTIGNSWNNKKLVLQVDHINGEPFDNSKDNLRFVCPNCHSQTSNYCRSKNRISKYSKKCIDCDKDCSRAAMRCKRCESVQKYGWKSKRPDIEQFKKDIIEFDNNMSAIGRKYSVSDNSVRKWIKYYKRYSDIYGPLV